jgi:hypothetical protein
VGLFVPWPFRATMAHVTPLAPTLPGGSPAAADGRNRRSSRIGLPKFPGRTGSPHDGKILDARTRGRNDQLAMAGHTALVAKIHTFGTRSQGRLYDPKPPFASIDSNAGPCRGFRMTAPSRAYPRAPGPSSESLQGRNPRDVGRSVAAGSMGISRRPLRMRPLMRWRAE